MVTKVTGNDDFKNQTIYADMPCWPLDRHEMNTETLLWTNPKGSRGLNIPLNQADRFKIKIKNFKFKKFQALTPGATLHLLRLRSLNGCGENKSHWIFFLQIPHSVKKKLRKSFRKK